MRAISVRSKRREIGVYTHLIEGQCMPEGLDGFVRVCEWQRTAHYNAHARNSIPLM
jgi:hypothetical protein